MINKNNQFHLRTKKLTAVPYKLQNSWEEIFDVPLYVVYELTGKTTPDSKLQIFQFKLLYNILATNRMLCIWGIQSSQLYRFCCEEAESLGPGMAEELQLLPRTNAADSNTGRFEKP